MEDEKDPRQLDMFTGNESPLAKAFFQPISCRKEELSTCSEARLQEPSAVKSSWRKKYEELEAVHRFITGDFGKAPQGGLR